MIKFKEKLSTIIQMEMKFNVKQPMLMDYIVEDIFGSERTLVLNHGIPIAKEQDSLILMEKFFKKLFLDMML